MSSLNITETSCFLKTFPVLTFAGVSVQGSIAIACCYNLIYEGPDGFGISKALRQDQNLSVTCPALQSNS